MKPVALFAIAVVVSFWALDNIAFDGVYTTKIWRQGNAYGQDWQREAKVWVRHHSY
jgi:hypothetical protein